MKNYYDQIGGTLTWDHTYIACLRAAHDMRRLIGGCAVRVEVGGGDEYIAIIVTDRGRYEWLRSQFPGGTDVGGVGPQWSARHYYVGDLVIHYYPS